MGIKDYSSRNETFAKGGGQLGRTKDFLKTENRFLDHKFKAAPKTEDNYAKGVDPGGTTAPPAKGKSLPAVKGRG